MSIFEQRKCSCGLILLFCILNLRKLPISDHQEIHVILYDVSKLGGRVFIRQLSKSGRLVQYQWFVLSFEEKPVN